MNPKYDLQAIIDLSGACIPGHGTPTLILFARNQQPGRETVHVLSNVKGEPGIPTNPAQGEVWQSVVRSLEAGPGYTDDFVDVAARPREVLGEHPWQFGGPKSRLYERIRKNSFAELQASVESIGITLFTLADDVYVMPHDFARRLNLEYGYVKVMVTGEEIRDWVIWEPSIAIFPYERDYSPMYIEQHLAELVYLSRYRPWLAKSMGFGGKTKVESGLQWFEYGRLTTSKYQTEQAITFPAIGTHAHFVADQSGKLYNRHAQVIKLEESDWQKYELLAAVLNTNLVCLCLKQVCFNKGAGEDPIRDRYEYASTNVGQTPTPPDYETDTPNRRRMLTLAEEIDYLAELLPTLTTRKLFEQKDEAYHAWNSALDGYVAPHPDLPPPFNSARELRAARDQLIVLHRDIRARMIFLQ